MENLNYEGKEFEFWGLTGVVLSSEKRTETTAHQTQGRVNTYGNNLDVTMPTTTFSSVLKHDFWIKKEDGTEESIHIGGVDIPLRSGQEVTLIYTSEKKEKHGYQSFFVNHSAGKFWVINDAEELTKKLNVFNFFWKSLLISLITLFGVAISLSETIMDVNDAETTAYFVAAGVLFYRLFVGFRRKLKFKKLLDAHLTSLARSITKKT